MFIAAFIYFSIGVLIGLYILGAHIRATFEYFRQLYTAKEVRPSDIKTYFGTKYWKWASMNNDPWGEVLVMTTIPAIMFTVISIVGWPIGSVLLLNLSIKRARSRIEND